jgi:hypothetical protein
MWGLSEVRLQLSPSFARKKMEMLQTKGVTLATL